MAEKWVAPNGLVGVQAAHDELVEALHALVRATRDAAGRCTDSVQVAFLEGKIESFVRGSPREREDTRMTEKQQLLAMLAHIEADVQERPPNYDFDEDATVSTLAVEAGGYSGFYTVFCFDADDRLMAMAAYE